MCNIIKISMDNASTTNNGLFQGWGTSLCWWAHRIGYSPVLTKKSAKLFFSDKGLNLNIMRYNIGGGDDPTHKHIKRTDSMIPGWMKYNETSDNFIYDYDADKNQLNVLKECYNASGDNDFVEVFSNSPPYFMCKSRCSSGGKDPTQNNLRDDCYDEFAKYLADVTEYINNSLKIKVSSISPMNEPDTDFWHYLSEKQEGCHFDPGESQNKIILKTAREIRSRGLNHIDIVASDETSTDKAINSYNLYNDDVKKVVDRISTHTYGSDKIKELGDLMKAEQKNLWMSETDWSSVSGEDAGEMGAGLWFAQKIIYDINNLSPSAWVIWLTIDHHISRDGFMGNKDTGAPDINKGYWGIAFADHDNEEILLTKKYYCYGQFSRYIRPGDTILHTTNKSLGAYNKKDNKLTLVAVNDKNRKKQITIDITDFKNNGIIEVIRTSGDINSGENWAKVDEIVFNSPIITLELKANSVTTFIIK